MSKRAIYYDTETTGVRAENDRIIEIAAYDPENDLTFEKLVNPAVPIPAEASAIHGISDDMVRDAPSFAVIGQEFIDFCSGDVVLIAHNNDGFDKHFLANEGKRHDIIWPEWDMLDSLKWARKYRPDLPRHSLQYLRQVFGIQENNAHRALDDVVVLYKVFSIMIDDLPIETVLNLMEAAANELPEVMPFGKHQGKALEDVPSNYIAWLKKEGALDKPDNAQLKKAFEKLATCSK